MGRGFSEWRAIDINRADSLQDANGLIKTAVMEPDGVISVTYNNVVGTLMSRDKCAFWGFRLLDPLGLEALTTAADRARSIVFVVEPITMAVPDTVCICGMMTHPTTGAGKASGGGIRQEVAPQRRLLMHTDTAASSSTQAAGKVAVIRPNMNWVRATDPQGVLYDADLEPLLSASISLADGTFDAGDLVYAGIGQKEAVLVDSILKFRIWYAESYGDSRWPTP